MFSEKVGTTDRITAGLSKEVVPPEHPCPVCGKGMKDGNTRATQKAGLDIRICSSRSCRTKKDWSTGSPTDYEEPAEEVEVVEAAVAVAPAAPVGPEYPCPECGKAMKDANTTETMEAGLDVRICSSRICRRKADWSTGKAVVV